MECQNLHPSGKRIGKPRQQKHVRRTRQKEASRSTVIIDQHFNDRKGFRRALDFVENQCVVDPRQESVWIAADCRENDGIIQCQVPCRVLPLGKHSYECAFPCLPRAIKENNRVIL